MAFRTLFFLIVSWILCFDCLAEGMPPTVLIAKATTIKEASSKRYVGIVESIEHVNIVARITGTLLKINFKEDGIVKKGDMLYELEDTSFQASANALKAQKEQAEAELRYADTEFKRSNKLLKSNAISIASHDKTLSEIDVANAKIKELVASIADAENTLSYTKIYAPIGGRIGKSNLTTGNLVSEGDKLTDIEMIAPIYVRFSLSERIFRQDFGGREGIKEKAIVRIQLVDNTIYSETGKISLIDNKINSTTNTIMLWSTFDNSDHQLIPGSFVTVLLSIQSVKPFVAIVPSALIAQETGYSVYILDDKNNVIRKEVKVGNVADGLQIILSGLDGSERIIIDGMNKVKPGMTVTPVLSGTTE